MLQFGTELLEQVTGTYIVLFLAYFSLLLSWPLFFLLEKHYRVHQPTPRSNYIFNWQVTASNLLLAPAFLALAVLSMLYLARATGFPSLSIATSGMSVGIWIHHSRMPEHRDKNFAIWLPMFDIAFGSYYHPKVDEYPATGLASGEKMGSVWRAQREPFAAWSRMLKSGSLRRLTERPG